MKQLNEDNFQNEIAKGLTIIDFWADWCGPCKMMTPKFEELAKDMSGVKFAKVNVDDQAGIASEFGVMSIPTFVIYKDGKEVDRVVGAVPKDSIKAKLESHL